MGIGQGPEPQLVVKATQSATVVSASHLSFFLRKNTTCRQHYTVHSSTHTKNTIYYTTLQWAFLLFQFNVQWFGLNRYCFLSNLQVSFWAHPKTFRYFLTSLFQERKVFLFSRILLKSKYFSEVDQVCTILSRVFPFRASTVLSTSHLLFSRSPLTPRQEESLDKSPVTLDDGASVTMRADAQFEHAANRS